MAAAYLPEVWRDLFVMVGTAAASLVGLLFVVMSLHINAIRERPDDNMSATIHAARNNTYHLLTALVTAALVLIPQPPPVLGAELVAVHLFGLRLPVIFTYRYFIENSGGFPFSMIVTISAGYLLGAAGGAALIGHAGWGLYLIAASCVIILVRSVLTAWMLMFGRRRDDSPPTTDQPS
jgi:hypothetical protein